MQKIKFGFQQFNIVDGTHVPRCFHCFGFFHKASDCPNKNNEKKCIMCAEVGHAVNECKNELKCNNCVEFNAKNKNAKIDTKHSIIDEKCPCYQKVFKSLVRNIEI